MKLLIDSHLSENNLTGIGRYINELIMTMTGLNENQKFSLLTKSDLSETHPLMKLQGVNRIPVQLKGPSLKQNIFIPKILKREKPDVYHHPHFDLPLGIRIPSVITVHDLKYIRHPDFFSGVSRVKSKYMKWMMGTSIQRAKKVIAVSESTKRDLIEFFNEDPEKIRVIHHGRFAYQGPPNHNIRLSDLNIYKPFILFVSERRPHKNIPNLIRAYHHLKMNKKIDYQLVIVGKCYSDYIDPERLTNRLKMNNDIIFTGYLEDDVLDFLYKNAYLFILPSLYEGFGFPLLEAMYHGVPVLGSNVTSIPEIIGDAGFTFDPNNVEEMSSVMHRALTDLNLRALLKERGYRRVKGFTWEKAARKTLDVYHEIYEESKK